MPRKPWDPLGSRARAGQTGQRGAVGRRGQKVRQTAHPQSRRYRTTDRDRVLLYGWHPVKAALENPRRRIRKLMVTENALRRLKENAIHLPVEAQVVSSDSFSAYVPVDAVHQGILAEADPLPPCAIEDVNAEGILLVLDQITDPHNVGAILRSAAAFAVTALVTTSRHSPEATGVVAKSASGALEHVPIVTIPNLARGLEALKARGYLVVGLDSDAEFGLAGVPLRLPLALVLGAERKGLRQLTRTTCDVLARLALPGRIQSLNVSNAAALALHIASAKLARPA